MAGTTPTNTALEGDFAAIETAVMETARGRWFLAEYARRNRSADTDMVLEAIARLEPAAASTTFPADLALRIDELHRLVATMRAGAPNGSGDDRRPVHARPVQAAENAIAAIRRTTEKIREVSFELRETARLGIYAEALDLYCHDLTSAVGFQETSTRQLTDLAAMLGAVETRVIALVEMTRAEATPEAAKVTPQAAKAPEPAPMPSPTPVISVEEKAALPPPLPAAVQPAASGNGQMVEKRPEPAPAAASAPAQPSPQAAAVAVGGSGRAFLFVRPG
jgi:hypothetical protein